MSDTRRARREAERAFRHLGVRLGAPPRHGSYTCTAGEDAHPGAETCVKVNGRWLGYMVCDEPTHLEIVVAAAVAANEVHEAALEASRS